MKNYIKPTAEVVELSVKESLSRNLINPELRTNFRKTTIAATTYSVIVSDLKVNSTTLN